MDDAFPELIDQKSGFERAFGMESVVRVKPYKNLLGEKIDTGHILLLDYDFDSYSELSEKDKKRALAIIFSIDEEIKRILKIPGFLAISSDRGLHFLGTGLFDYEQWLSLYDGKQDKLSACSGHYSFSSQKLPNTDIRSITLRIGYKRNVIPELIHYIS